MQAVLAELRTPRPLDLSQGAEPAVARARLLDEALETLTGRVLGPSPTLALAAVGGYGRGQLSPHSDVDLLVLVKASSEVTASTVRGLLYPLWDAGFQVGHAVRTPKETIERASSDLDAATSILSARHVAGDEESFGEFVDRRRRWLERDRRKLARRIAESTQQRHQRVDRAGWMLAPDLKEDVGGLRDVHRLRWLHALVPERPWPEAISSAEATLLAVREALHSHSKRPLERIRIDLQKQVALTLGFQGDDAANHLMHEVHSAARTIEHDGSLFELEMLDEVLGGPRRSGERRILSAFTRQEDNALTVARDAPHNRTAAVDLLAQRAHVARHLSPEAVRWLKDTFAASADEAEWETETRDAFFHLLRGPHVASALELMDHAGGWKTLMPEWLRIRALAQHDAYHRYTVDAHLFMTVSQVSLVVAEDPVAATAADEVGDLDLLYLGALLHDIGKGSGEDHSVVGERLARSICTRMGLSAEDVRLVSRLVRYHLTLVDTATRRDLDDGGVIGATAETIGDPRQLRFLYILSLADGRATGPEGWSEWKGALVRDLYKKTLVALETGTLPLRSDVRSKAQEVEAYEPSLAGRALEVLETLPPSYLASADLPDMVDDIRLLSQSLEPGGLRHRLDPGAEGESVLTLCVPDRPGALARTAGVLALHRISVLRAQAFATTHSIALQRFIVSLDRVLPWKDVLNDLEAAYSGRLALEARLDKKIRDYAQPSPDADVRVLREVSEHSTLIEVRTSVDAIGLLYGIAAALGDLDLDIHVAKIHTLGSRVVDVFYVRDAWGAKLNDEQITEVRRAIQHRLARLYRT